MAKRRQTFERAARKRKAAQHARAAEKLRQSDEDRSARPKPANESKTEKS